MYKRQVYEDTGYVIDTHTGVASCVYRNYAKTTGDTKKTVIASTASPYKFSRSVVEAIEGPGNSDDEFTSVSYTHLDVYKRQVLCHNGKIYMYSANEEINKNYYELLVESYIKNGYNEDRAQVLALSEIQMNFDIDFKEVIAE